MVTVHGPTDPALAGTKYRLLVHDVTAGGTPTPVTAPFFVVNSHAIGSWVTPDPGGWTDWPTWNANTLGTLGYINSSGDDTWEVQLELQSTSTIVDSQVFQLDNTLATASADPANSAHLAVDLGQVSAQACGKFTQGMTITGTFDAHDTYFGAWSFDLLPTALPANALSTSVSPRHVAGPVRVDVVAEHAGPDPVRLRPAAVDVRPGGPGLGHDGAQPARQRRVLHRVTRRGTPFPVNGRCPGPRPGASLVVLRPTTRRLPSPRP